MSLAVIIWFLSIIGRISVGAVLGFAGLAKLQAGASRFMGDLLAYELLPGWFVAAVAYWLPPIEIVLAVLLLIGVFTPFAAISAFLLLALFTAVLTITLYRGKEIGCGCFGEVGVTKMRWGIVYRNMGLMLIMLPVLAESPQWLWLLACIWLITLAGVVFIRLVFRARLQSINDKRSVHYET